MEKEKLDFKFIKEKKEGKERKRRIFSEFICIYYYYF